MHKEPVKGVRASGPKGLKPSIYSFNNSSNTLHTQKWRPIDWLHVSLELLTIPLTSANHSFTLVLAVTTTWQPSLPTSATQREGEHNNNQMRKPPTASSSPPITRLFPWSQHCACCLFTQLNWKLPTASDHATISCYHSRCAAVSWGQVKTVRTEFFRLLGYYAALDVLKQTFRNYLSTPSSRVNTLRNNSPVTHSTISLFILTETCFGSSLSHHQALMKT